LLWLIQLAQVAYGILAHPPTPNLFKKKFIFARNSHYAVCNTEKTIHHHYHRRHHHHHHYHRRHYHRRDGGDRDGAGGRDGGDHDGAGGRDGGDHDTETSIYMVDDDINYLAKAMINGATNISIK